MAQYYHDKLEIIHSNQFLFSHFLQTKDKIEKVESVDESVLCKSYLLFQPQSKMLTSLRTLTRRVATKRCFTSSSAALDELKTANKPKATNIHHFKVYRWDPDQDQDVSI